MWLLQSDEGIKIYLPVGKSLTFGRKKADVILKEDDSISRTHASITVLRKKEISKFSEATSSCVLKDLGSKYGTFIIKNNGKQQLNQGIEHCVASNDVISFGIGKHKFTITYIHIVTTTSMVDDDGKNELKTIMDTIDGCVSSDWTRDCTHLTVSVSSLTEKVTCALAQSIPIVTMDYWGAVVRTMEAGSDLPDPSKYIPLLTEKYINNDEVSFLPNKKRTKLFNGLIFVHLTTAQYKIYAKIISAAGGNSVFYPRTSISKEKLCAKNVIVLQFLESDSTQATQTDVSKYEDLYNVLAQKKRRPIPECEIPLAILYCSNERYCNPTYNFANALLPVKREDSQSTVLVADTCSSQLLAHPSKDVAGRRAKQVICFPRKDQDTSNDNVIIPETNCSFGNESQGKLQCLKVKSIHIINTEKTIVLKNLVHEEKEKKLNYCVIPETEEIASEANVQPYNESTEKINRNAKDSSICRIIPETDDNALSEKSESAEEKSQPESVRDMISKLGDAISIEFKKDKKDVKKSQENKIYSILPETIEENSSVESRRDEKSPEKIQEKRVHRVLPETNEDFSIESRRNDKSQEKIREKRVYPIIPETNEDLSMESRRNEKSQEKIREKRVYPIIPETNEDLSMESRRNDKSQEKIREKRVYPILPETNENLSGTSNDDFGSNIQNPEQRKDKTNTQKEQEKRYLKEQNDISIIEVMKSSSTRMELVSRANKNDHVDRDGFIKKLNFRSTEELSIDNKIVRVDNIERDLSQNKTRKRKIIDIDHSNENSSDMLVPNDNNEPRNDLNQNRNKRQRSEREIHRNNENSRDDELRIMQKEVEKNVLRNPFSAGDSSVIQKVKRSASSSLRNNEQRHTFLRRDKGSKVFWKVNTNIPQQRLKSDDFV